MFRATIKSLLARKLRLLLTAIAIVLGVGFTAGTFVLTDTALKSFDSLFNTAFVNIDVVVQAKQGVGRDHHIDRWPPALQYG